jgi:hypothetical protein
LRNEKRLGTPRKTKWQFHESHPFVFCERERERERRCEGSEEEV